MSARAERRRRDGVPQGCRRELDRTWLGRIALAVIVAVSLALVARVSMMAFSGSGKRMERFEHGVAQEAGASLPPGTRALPQLK
jgi:hypothetical protein